MLGTFTFNCFSYTSKKAKASSVGAWVFKAVQMICRTFFEYIPVLGEVMLANDDNKSF